MPKKVVSRLKPHPKYRHFIRAWRKYRGLTQEQLAERVDLSTSSISQLETGEQGYSQGTLEALADALNCEPGDLLIRNPLDGAAIWTIWEQLKPAQKRQAVEMLKIIKGAEAA